MSETVTERGTLTLNDLDHDPERDRPWHIPRHPNRGVGQPSVALCGTRYIARAPTSWSALEGPNMCVVCRDVVKGGR